jgi:hypothetical protein
MPRRRRQAIDFLSPEEDLALRSGYVTFQERNLISLLR